MAFFSSIIMVMAFLGQTTACSSPPPPPPPPAVPPISSCGSINCGVTGANRRSRLTSPPQYPYSGKIVNGQSTTIEELPWQVGLARTTSNFIFCGGSILNTRWILTAAHCVEDLAANDIRAVVGMTFRSSFGTAFRVAAGNRILHPNYNFPSFDLALLGLEGTINFASLGARARPICWENTPAQLAPRLRNENFWAIASGWGRLGGNSNSPNQLQFAWLRTYKTSECSRAQVYSSIVCLDGHTTTRSACFGDSGGPLSVQWNGKWQLLGAASFVTSNCNGLTGYATLDTTAIINWIRGRVGSEC